MQAKDLAINHFGVKNLVTLLKPANRSNKEGELWEKTSNFASVLSGFSRVLPHGGKDGLAYPLGVAQ